MTSTPSPAEHLEGAVAPVVDGLRRTVEWASHLPEEGTFRVTAGQARAWITHIESQALLLSERESEIERWKTAAEANTEEATEWETKWLADHEASETKISEARAEVERHKRSFELRWNSDLRAKKRWQESTGREMEWPDHADLSVWLLARLESAEARLQQAVEGLESLKRFVRADGATLLTVDGINFGAALRTTLAAIQGDSHEQ